MLNKETHKYGARLEFMHIKENFEEESLDILEYILKYAEIIKYTNEVGSRYSISALDKSIYSCFEFWTRRDF